MEQTLLTKIIDFIFGRKYYATIINTRGTGKCEICCFIHHSRAEAEKHKQELQNNMSFLYVETISFRSRKDY